MMLDGPAAPGLGTQPPLGPAAPAQTDVAVFFQQAVQLHKVGQWQAAEFLYQQVLARQAQHFDALHLLGLIALQNDQPVRCLDLIDQAMALNPSNPTMYFHRALAHEKLQQWEPALASYEDAIAIKPDYVQALVNCAAVQKRLGQWEATLASLARALRADPACVPAHLNSGNAYSALGQWDAAISHYRSALDLAPQSEEASIYLAKALRMAGHLDAAIAHCETALVLHPQSALAHWNMAHLLLLDGQWERGWEHYEWRWQYAENAKYRRHFPVPMWDGVQSLAGKTLLLHHEQGLGDTLQFCRYALLCSQRGARVLLEVPPALVALMQGLQGVSAVLESGQPLPALDYHCPLLSLPWLFQTTVERVPHAAAYLHAPATGLAAWQSRVGTGDKLKVGIVWSGGVRPEQAELNAARNMPLATMAAALQHLDVDFYSLQKGEPAQSELRGHEAQHWPAGNFFNFTDALHDFADTAGLVAMMDLVISVDTSTLHLAAAMGRPTWLLNKYETCWRWLLGRDDSPWYPSLRLYRQDARMQWQPVLERVAADLARLAQAHAHARGQTPR